MIGLFRKSAAQQWTDDIAELRNLADRQEGRAALAERLRLATAAQRLRDRATEDRDIAERMGRCPLNPNNTGGAQ